MWWSAKNGLSKTMTDRASDEFSAPSSSASTISQSKSIEQMSRMMREIGDDMTGVMNKEKEQLMTEFAERARSWCMKDISHDLRTPLNAIIGFAQMMENGALGQIENPQYIEYLRHIRESGYDLLGKVETLMDATPTKDTGHEAPLTNVSKLEEAVA